MSAIIFFNDSFLIDVLADKIVMLLVSYLIFFTMAPTLVGPWSSRHPNGGPVTYKNKHVCDAMIDIYREVGKISRHYPVGNGFALCQPLVFSHSLHIFDR